MNRGRMWQLNFGKGQSILVFICILGSFLFVENRAQAQGPELSNWRDLYDWDEMAGGGFKRPGKLQLHGRKTGKPAPFFFWNDNKGWFVGIPSNPITSDDTSATSSYLKELGVKYHSNNDKGDGRVVAVKFKYRVVVELRTGVSRTWNPLAFPESKAALVINQDGVLAGVQYKSLAAYRDSGTTITIPIVPPITIPLSFQTDSAPVNIDRTLTWKNPGPISIPHFAGSPFEHFTEFDTHGKLEFYKPIGSSISASAKWNFYIEEGHNQLTRRESIIFQSP